MDIKEVQKAKTHTCERSGRDTMGSEEGPLGSAGTPEVQ